MCIVLYVKCPLFLSDFNETLDLFPKNNQISYFMKIRPVAVECSMWTDGNDEANISFSQFCERA